MHLNFVKSFHFVHVFIAFGHLTSLLSVNSSRKWLFVARNTALIWPLVVRATKKNVSAILKTIDPEFEWVSTLQLISCYWHPAPSPGSPPLALKKGAKWGGPGDEVAREPFAEIKEIIMKSWASNYILALWISHSCVHSLNFIGLESLIISFSIRITVYIELW